MYRRSHSEDQLYGAFQRSRYLIFMLKILRRAAVVEGVSFELVLKLKSG